MGFDFQVARFERFFEHFSFFFFEVDPFAAHEGGALGSGQSYPCGGEGR
ncbi:MAG: hypothetical protein ACJAQT_002547 [Akkermansiaceae bacterium]